MRDPNRLSSVYEEIARLHAEYLPDWRIGQFWVNFARWMEIDKRRDIFFPEEDKLLEYVVEFVNTMSPYKRVDNG